MTRSPMNPPPSSWKRARQRVAHSIKLRLVLVFLLLAAAMTFVFITGAQRAFSIGWREAARPLLVDYVDRLVADVAGAGGTPDIERARAITDRLPLTIAITGPRINWQSHPHQSPFDGLRDNLNNPDDLGQREGRTLSEGGDGGKRWQSVLRRTTADGHNIEFGFNGEAFERRPRWVGFALTALLVLTLLAFLCVRYLLSPLDGIRAGAQRFGAGNFAQPIPVRHPQRPDELGQLAATINTMGQDIRQMLDAKRALLLAISHELRSPLTRARLNTELLPETADARPQRDALLRDLQEMANLIADLLESERLATRHAALQREPVALATLAAEVVAELLARQPARPNTNPDTRPNITLCAAPDLPTLALDPTRMRLLLRNLLDNALRHSGGAAQPTELHLRPSGNGIQIDVRDHGAGVPEQQIPHLAEPFFRPDTARTRAQGGVGLGLYLCKLVAQAHGGTFAVRNALPGLAVTVTLPGNPGAL